MRLVAALRDEAGAGGVSVLGTVAAGAALLLAVAALGHASATGAEAAGAADLAALAASDARRGISAHPPCDLAAEVARRHRARLVSCAAVPDGTVRVEVELSRSPLPPARATTVAGPPSLT